MAAIPALLPVPSGLTSPPVKNPPPLPDPTPPKPTAGRRRNPPNSTACRVWGHGFFGVNKQGPRHRPPRRRRRPAEVSLFEVIDGLRDRGTDLPVLLRFRDLLHSRIARAQRVVPQGDQGHRLPRRIPRRLSDQGQPAAAGHRGDRRVRQTLPLRPRSRLQARTDRRARPHARPRGLPRLQRLQGRGVHRPRPARPEDGPAGSCWCSKCPASSTSSSNARASSACCRTSASASASPPAAPATGRKAPATSRSSASTPPRSSTSSIASSDDGYLGCLRMLHYHQGSQIPNIAAIREGATEAARMYCDLVKEGAPMGVLDIGGGMAVDYDGSHTNFHSSCNYSVARILHRRHRGDLPDLRQGRRRPSRTSSPRAAARSSPTTRCSSSTSSTSPRAQTTDGSPAASRRTRRRTSST